MTRLVVATLNAGTVRDFQEALGTAFELVTAA